MYCNIYFKIDNKYLFLLSHLHLSVCCNFLTTGFTFYLSLKRTNRRRCLGFLDLGEN